MSTIQGPSPTQNNLPPAASQKQESFWGDDGFTFGDLVDVVNPLQHIPVVSHIYRSVTGDERSTGAQVIGGALFGGVAGLVTSFVDASVRDNGGESVAEQMVAAFSPQQKPTVPGNSPAHEAPVMLAQAEEAPALVTEIGDARPLIEEVPLPTESPDHHAHLTSAVPEAAIAPAPLIASFHKPSLSAIPDALPEQAQDSEGIRRARVQEAIQKYLAATAELEEDAAQDKYATIASELLL